MSVFECDAGDKVIVRQRFGDSVKTVKRKTPSGRIVLEMGSGREWVFNPNGSERGAASAWSRARLEAWTEGAERDARNKALRAAVANLSLRQWSSTATVDELEAVMSIVKRKDAR